MYRKGSSHMAKRHGNGRIALTVALTALCALVSSGSDAQLPSLIDLGVPLGQEVSPVYRVFGDNASDGLGGDSLQSGALAFGDFNGDGRCDLLVQDRPDSLSVYLSTGEAFAPEPAMILSQQDILAFGIADVNGDGRSDVVAQCCVTGDEEAEPRSVVFFAREVER